MVENLRALRIARGMSQQQLADAIGVTQQAIHQYETDKVEPDIENLKRIAATLDVSIDHLVGTENKKRSALLTVSETEFKMVEKYRSLNASDKKYIIRLIDLMQDNETK